MLNFKLIPVSKLTLTFKIVIRVDSYRYFNSGEISSFYIKLLTRPGLRFMYFFRLCQYYKLFHPLGLFSRFIYKRMQVKYGFQIPHTCKIGRGLFLGHYGNIVINQDVEVGENCNIAQGVTIGHISRGSKKGSPKIGDRVWIGANAVVVGKISIGDDVLIAPLSFINFDVPDKAVVVGNPAQIVSFSGSGGYIKNI
ncbi:serine O-acetyltransferase [Pontibacter anaerobius]|uniref:Serine acetyltransferase n=1 Tax=Pontibacter anaerobius TaxID=2993940 RepID=A0ABT3RDN8_9BACT|nr:serine O-acetyltransferase [Pontibacter anaerobius]MCX2739967.1 serine O-acetyltransferase [Pontibacter anaerobius]